MDNFTTRFLTAHRRQIQRKDSMVEFLVPDVLKPFQLPERFRNATFNRETAIRRTDVDFLALGHPFVDAMLGHVGSYDFGGLTCGRRINKSKLAGRTGYLFLFIVRERLTRDDGDECLFKFVPVFVTASGSIDDEAAAEAVSRPGEELDDVSDCLPDANESFLIAQKHLEVQADIWSWEDDVEFLGMSWTVFAASC